MDDICVMLMANWDQAGSVFAMDLIWGFLPEEGASERQMKSQPWDCGDWLLMLMAQRAGFVEEILGDRRCVKTSRSEQ